MSYILEALRKAERERQLGETPSLPDLVSDPPLRPRSRWPWLAAGLLLALNAGVLWQFWPHGKAAPEPASAPPAPQAQAEPAPPAASAAKSLAAAPLAQTLPVETPARPAKPPAAPIARPTKAPPALREATPVESRPAGPANPPPAGDETFGKPLARQARTDVGISTEDKPLPPPGPSAFAKRMPRPSPEEQEAEPFVPSLNEMPPEIKENAHDLKINVLAYSSAPEERFAVINMVKYTKGERLPGGAVVQDIQAHGVVLELDGRRFRVSNR